MELAGKRVYVVGLGSHGTGRQLARVLTRRGAAVTVADQKPAEKLVAELAQLEDLPVQYELGGDYGAGVTSHDLVVISPGVPPESAVPARARAAGVPVLGELELAYRLCPAPMVAITGTKGKTTTTTLTGRLLAAAGYRVHVGGNIGEPLVGIADTVGTDEVVVAEVSSFLLEGTTTFRPKVGVLLNLHEDHLDRHGTMAAYLAAKARLFANQTAEDTAIVNAEDPVVAGLAGSLRARTWRFALGGPAVLGDGEGVTVEGGQIVLRQAGRMTAVCPASALRLPGRHNVANALAAVAALAALGGPLDRVEQTLREFEGVPNRLEPVAEVGGVLFVNDSQGTCKAAVACALEAFSGRRTVLIAGGRAKVADFADLAAAIARRAEAVVLIGEAAPALAAAAQAAGMAQVERAATLPEAVARAYELARPAGVVLLSPACASFDMFENMEHRGEVFRQAVRGLAGKGAGGA